MMRRTLLQLAGLLVPALAQAREAVWLRIRNDSPQPFEHVWLGQPRQARLGGNALLALGTIRLHRVLLSPADISVIWPWTRSLSGFGNRSENLAGRGRISPLLQGNSGFYCPKKR